MDSQDSVSLIEEKHTPVWAQLVSDIFSPILMPTYGMALAMWCTNLRNLPESNRVLATVLVAVVTGLIPFIAILLLIKAGKIHSRSIANPRERILPMSVAACCYLGAGMLVSSIGAPRWLTMFFVSGATATVLAMIITLRWKISAHTTAVGVLVGMALWCCVSGLADVSAIVMLSVLILIAGFLATARLLLERHTFGQVASGLALGIACAYGMMWL